MLLADNAATRLASAFSNVATSFVVEAGQGDRFPAVSGGDYFYVTLEDASLNREVVKVRTRAAGSDLFSDVIRGAVPRHWAPGDAVEMRGCQALLRDLSRQFFKPLTGASTVTTSDIGRVILCDCSGGAWSLTFTAAATLGDGFWCEVVRADSSTNPLTLDFDGSEVVEGVPTFTLWPGDRVVLATNGAAWIATSLGGVSGLPAIAHSLDIGTPAGAASPFIDFHSGPVSNDYDARFYGSGGSVPSGYGTLHHLAARHRLETPNAAVGPTLALAKPATGSTLAGDLLVDLFGTILRFMEEGAPSRGAYLDFTECGSQSKIWHEGNDGPDSGLDADLLDGLDASAFVRIGGSTLTGPLIMPSLTVQGGGEIGLLLHNTDSPSSGFPSRQVIAPVTGSRFIFRAWSPETGKIQDFVLRQPSSSSGSFDIVHSGQFGHDQGIDADKLDGRHGSEFVLAETPAQGQLGVRRLYRQDHESAYFVSTLWDGTYWNLLGYYPDGAFHAGCRVAYSDLTGVYQGPMSIGGPSEHLGQALLVTGANGATAQFLGLAADRGNPSGTQAALRLWRMSGTNRSISAAGTLNANGSDYAEYMVKASDCGLLAKGQVVGIDAEGRLTDRWSCAHSFAIKSTDPALVGGDTWSTAAGEPPVDDLLDPPPPASDLRGQAPDDSASEQAPFKKAHVQTQAKRLAELSRRRTEYESRLEVERQKVDRIAFSGRVPCQVRGPCQPGQWIVPVEGPDDTIVATAVEDRRITFDQYRRAVGRVWAWLPDGRPLVAVKVG